MLRKLMMSLAVLLFSTLARAEPVTLDGTEQWTMKSAEGREYRIMVSLPEGDVPWTGGYPVIAAVASHHLDLAGQIPINAQIRFNPIEAFAELELDASHLTADAKNQP